MPEKPYDQNQIELKWYERWQDATFYRAEENSSKPKFYLLEMLPYPSGALHIGHIRNYSIGDALARYKWMRGFNVLHPMGWDAFGLPAENAAILNKAHPRDWTRQNIAKMKATHRRFAHIQVVLGCAGSCGPLERHPGTCKSGAVSRARYCRRYAAGDCVCPRVLPTAGVAITHSV